MSFIESLLFSKYCLMVKYNEYFFTKNVVIDLIIVHYNDTPFLYGWFLQCIFHV